MIPTLTLALLGTLLIALLPACLPRAAGRTRPAPPSDGAVCRPLRRMEGGGP